MYNTYKSKERQGKGCVTRMITRWKEQQIYLKEK